MLPPVVSSSTAARAQRRQTQRVVRRQLPQVCLVFCVATKMVLGAMVVSHCLQSDDSKLIWTVSRFVGLTAYYTVQQSDYKYHGKVFSLKPDIEKHIRMASVSIGGSLCHHFSEFANSIWKVWGLEKSICEKIRLWDGFPIRFSTLGEYARATGIQAEAQADDAAQVVAILESVAEHGGIAPVPGVAADVEEMPVDANLSSEISARLHGLHVDQQGACAKKFLPEGILSCLQLAAQLKPSVAVEDALAHAAAIILGRDDPISSQLRQHVFAIPGLQLMRMARVRLDLMNILFQRQLFIRYRYVRYIMVDSSPQLGFNFFCMREDRIAFPREEFVCAEYRVMTDLNIGFETRICSTSTLGLGNAGLVKKGTNTANVYLMESEKAAEFHEVREELKGSCSDSGTEKDIGDDTINIIKAFRGMFAATDPRSFMYPCLLHIAGHLHILFNAFETAVKSLDESKQFLEVLRVLLDFLSNKQLRQKFQAACLRNTPAFNYFNSHPTVHIDWRWETLSIALDKLVPIYRFILQYWNEAKMKQGETSQLNSQLILHVTRVLTMRYFLPYAEMIRVVGKSIEHFAHKLEGCWCHSHIWMQSKCHKRKLSQLYEETGFKSCVWKGRMAVWFVAVGLKELLDSVTTWTSPFLEELIASISDATIMATVLAAQSQLRSRLLEEFREKFGFWNHIPYKSVGVFYALSSL